MSERTASRPNSIVKAIASGNATRLLPRLSA
jgi:hypothetical protein